MKKVTVFVLFFIISYSVFPQKYFEGMVEYQTSFQSSNPALPESNLKERFGVKVRFYYKNGNYIREYLDEAGYSLRKFIFRVDKNLVYEINIFNPDTVLFYDAGEKLYSNYQINKGETDTILNCICPSSVITYSFYEKMLSDTLCIKSEYFFCNQLPVNPDHYKKYYLWYDVIKDQKSVALKFSEETVNYFKITYEAGKIDHKELPVDFFDIDKRLVLKKLVY